MSEFSARPHIAFSVEATHIGAAEPLVDLARYMEAGALQFNSDLAAPRGWGACAELADGYPWIANAEISSNHVTAAGIVRALKDLAHPPMAITISGASGREAMDAAQVIITEHNTRQTSRPAQCKDIKLLATLDNAWLHPTDAYQLYNLPANTRALRLAHDAKLCNLAGLVVPPTHISTLVKDRQAGAFFFMTPDIHSLPPSAEWDYRLLGRAIRQGADLVTIGRGVAQAKNPEQAYKTALEQIKAGYEAA